MSRPSLRHSFTVLSIGSLLLLIAAAVMWVRSYSVDEQYSWKTADGGRVIVGSGSGHVRVGDMRITTAPGVSNTRISSPPGYRSVPPGQDVNPLRPNWSFLGFRYTAVRFFVVVVRMLEVPYWALMVPGAVLPLLWYVRLLRRKTSPIGEGLGSLNEL